MVNYVVSTSVIMFQNVGPTRSSSLLGSPVKIKPFFERYPKRLTHALTTHQLYVLPMCNT